MQSMHKREVASVSPLLARMAGLHITSLWPRPCLLSLTHATAGCRICIFQKTFSTTLSNFSHVDSRTVDHCQAVLRTTSDDAASGKQGILLVYLQQIFKTGQSITLLFRCIIHLSLALFQPFCDGSHKGSGKKSLKFIVQRDEIKYLCVCKHTKNPPFCDGSHSSVGVASSKDSEASRVEEVSNTS